MGKKQHQSDKLWVTTKEWKTFFGGKKDLISDPDAKGFRRLPFDHCSFSLQPFETPYADEDGNIFDLLHIVPFIKKFKVNPVTGKKLSASGLTKLTWHKNSKGEYHCPVMFKVFNDSTHIATIKTTGNVFCYEAVEELNIKAKHWKDLLSDEPFTRADIIVIQEPHNQEKFNFTSFHHFKNNLHIVNEELTRAAKDPRARLKKVNAETRDVLDELDKTYVAPERKAEERKKADKINAAPFSTGAVAASFTTTAADRILEHEPAILEEDFVRYERVTKKGYVRLVTNLGAVNLELHCDIVAKTCENFIKLALKKYYDDTPFHRSIKHFMIQGGDPMGTGEGGESFWGEPFKDEFLVVEKNLTHTGRGILSMANSGPNTNKSQFFITFRSAKHLDNKHTVFGRVVGGLDTLKAMEKVETDNKDRPIEDIRLERVIVFVDPFAEADEQLAKERQELVDRLNEKEESVKEKKEKKTELKTYSSGVGKFINPQLKKAARKLDDDVAGPSTSAPKKKKTAGYAFSNFSAW